MKRFLKVKPRLLSSKYWKDDENEDILFNTGVNREKKGLHKQLLQDVVDAIIPVAGLNIIGFDEGIVGLAG